MEVERIQFDKFGCGWSLGDIMQRAYDSYNLDITEKQAREIADNIEDQHNAEHGICWETIDWTIENFLREGKLK